MPRGIRLDHNISIEHVMNPITGVLVGDRIIIWNIDSSRALFGNGYFGKPLGIPKPKGNQFDHPLILDLIEGYYLIQTGKLKLFNMKGKEMSSVNIKSICRKQYVDFDTKYLVFQNLRDRGYVVSPGIKFGCDFAVYEHGPGIDHAPYLVQVYKSVDAITSTRIVLAGRLATTVKKQFILAIPKTDGKKVDFIGFDWWRA